MQVSRCEIFKYRKKVLYGELREYLGKIVRKLAIQKESSILEEYLMLENPRACFDSAEAFSSISDQVHQSQERHPDRKNLQRA